MSDLTRSQTRRFATIKAAAAYAACSERTIRYRIADGKLRAYRLGARAIRVDLNDLDALMGASAAN